MRSSVDVSAVPDPGHKDEERWSLHPDRSKTEAELTAAYAANQRQIRQHLSELEQEHARVLALKQG